MARIPMKMWENRVSVITGAAQGLGASCVKSFLQAGIIVVGLDILEDRMKNLRSSLPKEDQANFHPIYCDVINEKMVDATFDRICTQFGGVDLLVNSAGVHEFGMMCEVPMSTVNKVMQTNVNAIVHCTQRAFKSMRDRKADGHILMMNSISGHKTLPINTGVSNMYMPGKQALTAMSEVLRQEFRDLGTRVKVTNICPGFVETELVPDEYKEKLQGRMLHVDAVTDVVMSIINTPPEVQISDITIKPLGEFN